MAVLTQEQKARFWRDGVLVAEDARLRITMVLRCHRVAHFDQGLVHTVTATSLMRNIHLLVKSALRATHRLFFA